MIKSSFVKLTLIAVVIMFSAFSEGNKVFSSVQIFPAPEGIEPSKDYKVFVDDKPVFCYPTWRLDNQKTTNQINNRKVSGLSFAIFDFSRPVKVRLELRSGLISSESQVRVLPATLGITPSVQGNTIEFTLNSPGNVTIDPSGDSQNALHLFSNFPETDIPDPHDPNVIYYGPGVHNIESVVLKSGQTLYLAGGALVRVSPPTTGGTYKASGMEYNSAEPAVLLNESNVTIRGRGIISGMRSFTDMKRFNLIRGNDVENVTIRDIVVMEGANWEVHFRGCSNVRIEGLRVLGFFENSDGIAVEGGLSKGSTDVIVRNSFVHNSDDGLEIKSRGKFSVKNVRFENCQVWSDSGTPMGLTGEIEQPVENITWKGITVIHYPSFPASFPEGRAAILIMAQGGGRVRNILFEDIVVESNIGLRPAVRITNEKKKWNGAAVYPGTKFSEISGVTLRNVNMRNFTNSASTDKLLFKNGDPHTLHEVVLENVRINGKQVTATDNRIENLNAHLIIR
ncbi:MAG: right-handed parallel beta-helix repeat-containing protein [Porphyromonadaceae bacterium]|nr:right-handed parallel beta-helix repeat-containing protein [Porphyromonadaceae bacterium]